MRDVYALLRPCEPSRISSDDTVEIGGENTAKVKMTSPKFTEPHETSKGRGVASAEVLSTFILPTDQQGATPRGCKNNPNCT